MLKKHLYDSWKSIMELYMMNRPHGRMILASVEKGPLVWPTITVDGVTRLKEYTELTPAETIQADYDIKAINIILQGLLTKIYALISQHRIAKDIWEKIKLLMQGTSLTKQEREFNTKFLNTLPAEWSKFVTDVKLVKDLHTTNVDQIHAHLEQHERNSDPLALVVSHQMTQSPYQSHQHSYQKSQHQQIVSPRKRDDSWFKDKVLLVQAQASGQILHEEELAFFADPGIPEVALMANLSHYGSDALVEVHNHDNVNNNMINQVVHVMPSSEQSNVVKHSESKITSDSNIIPYSQYMIESQ
ncbi:hypothetical protein Tco_0012754 [Tanacetum coccineum]